MTKTIARAAFATAMAAAAFATPASAQDAVFELPDQCTGMSAIGGMDHSAMGHGDAAGDAGSDSSDLEGMPEHVQENMRRMDITMPAMEEGMMREDADVAFACAMIAHHQGAVDMAEVLLEYGDDPQMIALAEDIIAMQVAEIDQMTNWLVENVD